MRKKAKTIVAPNTTSNQVARLTKYVRDCRLTAALILLEKRGVTDDLARLVISMIQYLQEAV
ncbi:MAG: hypothetical protein KME22_08265 [Hassallia sp. WJT32-NPBG1]|jgi:hypothetical protein|nr:hypothetical protein [Hassallia sp. WJT32-NPBG1]